MTGKMLVCDCCSTLFSDDGFVDLDRCPFCGGTVSNAMRSS